MGWGFVVRGLVFALVVVKGEPGVDALLKQGGHISEEKLTIRQLEILHLIADGHSTVVIGNILGLSPLTVRKHRANMLLRLSLGSASALTAYAIRSSANTMLSGMLLEPVRLTSREKEIGELVVEGKTSKQIARQLKISDLTVRKHRENIRLKLGVSSISDLIKALASLVR